MGRCLAIARSSLSLLLVMLYFAFPGTPLLYLVVYPLVWLRPASRRFQVSWFMKTMSWGILAIFRLGGARFERRGRIPTDGPALLIMNHQSELDIPLATLMAEPLVPAFVPRAKYARGLPLVSPSIRLLGCPVVDPARDPRGAIEELKHAALVEQHGLLIYPEGHRTLDGELRPFKSAGVVAILETRRLPVYLVVCDGLWAGRRFVDFLTKVPRLRGVVEVLGPFQPPEGGAEELRAALEGWRATMAERLSALRGGGAGA